MVPGGVAGPGVGRNVDVKSESQERNNSNQGRNNTMKESISVAKDPVCGMTVDEATALHAENVR